MSDTLKIPQFAALQSPVADRADVAPAPQESSANPAESAIAVRPFAEVLKSKSSPSSPESTEEYRPDDAVEDPSFLAQMGDVQAPTDNPLAAQLLALLTADLPTGAAALAGETPAPPKGLMPVIAATDSVEQALPIQPPLDQLAMPAPAAAPIIVATPLTRMSPLVAAMPAPTSTPAMEPASGVAMAPTASTRAIEIGSAKNMQTGTNLPAGQPMFAAPTAISADGGKPAPGQSLSEPAGEFRPPLERMTESAGALPMQTTLPQPALPQNAADPVQIRMVTPFAQAGWAQEVDQQLTWMVSNTKQQADLVLNPPQLGRIEVTLVVKGDEVSASFASPHQAVREAIEESLVRLRESLAESGINLGQTHVGRDSSRDAPFMKSDGDGRQGNGPRRDASAPLTLPLTHETAWQLSRSRGMVDVFA